MAQIILDQEELGQAVTDYINKHALMPNGTREIIINFASEKTSLCGNAKFSAIIRNK